LPETVWDGSEWYKKNGRTVWKTVWDGSMRYKKNRETAPCGSVPGGKKEPGEPFRVVQRLRTGEKYDRNG
jgi:hypothetical protein